MSIFCGFLRQTPISDAEGLFETLTETMQSLHSGSSNHWSDKDVCLIENCSEIPSFCYTTALPLHDSLKNLTIVGLTLLHNRSNLGEAFGITSSELTSFSDSELILRAYCKWGENCPLHLIGDYAFAIWNAREKILFCARDHIGTVPFYYHLNSRRFIFATDIKVILAAPDVEDVFNDTFILSGLNQGFFYDHRQTFFEGIVKLPPAHTLIVSSRQVKLRRYWFPEFSSPIHLSSLNDYHDAFLELYQRVVADNLRDTSKVGIHVTGGLDSSGIAVLTARALRARGQTPPVGFCWQPPPVDPVSMDQALIAILGHKEGIRLNYQEMKSEDLLSQWRRNATQDPMTSTLAHEALVQRQAEEQGVHTMLSGHGGDEMISYYGNGYYVGLLKRGLIRRACREFRSDMGGGRRRFVRTVVQPLLPWKSEQSNYRPYIAPEFERRKLAISFGSFSHYGVHHEQIARFESGYLNERIEAWFISGLRHNLVYRYPLLDRRLIEFALGLPCYLYRENAQYSRQFVRGALDSVIPPEICWNTDKSDSGRTKILLKCKDQALIQIAQNLRNGVPPGMGHYVDLPRLAHRLETEVSGELHNDWSLVEAALSLLYF